MPALRSISARLAALGDARAARSIASLMADLLADLWRYGLLSGVALALDWSLLVGLVKAGMNDLPAAALSFFAGMVVAYVGSIVFVYRGRRGCPVFAEAIGFFLIGFAGLFVNVLLLFGFVKFLGLGVGLAKAPTAIGVFLFNFLMRRTLLFAGRPVMAILPDVASPPGVAIDLD